jgi:hypothetical protein
MDITDGEAAMLRAMDDPANVDMLAKVGTAAADAQVHADHFPAVFDLPRE